MKLEVTLPLPPPLNQMYRVRHTWNPIGRYGQRIPAGVYKAASVKSWEKEAYYSLYKAAKRLKTIEGDVYVGLTMYLKRDRDIDSSAKSTLDLLQKAKVFVNDKQVRMLLIKKYYDKENPRLEVQVNEVKI